MDIDIKLQCKTNMIGMVIILVMMLEQCSCYTNSLDGMLEFRWLVNGLGSRSCWYFRLIIWFQIIYLHVPSTYWPCDITKSSIKYHYFWSLFKDVISSSIDNKHSNRIFIFFMLVFLALTWTWHHIQYCML